MNLLVFDMGHVFVDFEWESVCRAFSDRAGCDLQRLRGVFSEVAQLGYESGLIDTAGFLAELNGRLATNLTRDEFTKLFTHTFRENAEMALLLQELKKQRPLYLLSNTNEVHYEWLQSTFDVARHFDELILSYKVGCSKPDLEIYREVLRRSGMAAEQCLFVDDLECNVNAASSLGMNVIQFKGVDHLKQELRGHGFAV